MASRQTVAILEFEVERAQISFDYDCDTQPWKHVWRGRLELEKLHVHLEI